MLTTGLVLELFVGGEGGFVLDDVGEIVRFVVADGGVERGGPDGGGLHLAPPARCVVSSSWASSSRSVRGRASHAVSWPCAGRSWRSCPPVPGQTDGLGLVGQGAFDGLLDPPRAVRSRVCRPWARVRPLDPPFHQADVALADQIQQWQAGGSRSRGRFWTTRRRLALDQSVSRAFLSPRFDSRAASTHFLLLG